MYEEFKDKVVLVTAAGSGVGKITAKKFADLGAKVVAADISEERLAALEEEIKADGGNVTTVIMNAADQASTEEAVAKTLEIDGEIFAVASCVGVPDDYRKSAATTDKEWAKCTGINLDGTFWLTRAVLQPMLEKGAGRIVTVSSDCGLGGGRAGLPYTATKWGVVGMTKNIAYMHAKDGIRANCIRPGGINTNFLETSGVDPEGMGLIMAGCQNAPGQCEADEIADVMIFCLSDGARALNGAAIPVDKGWIAF